MCFVSEIINEYNHTEAMWQDKLDFLKLSLP